MAPRGDRYKRPFDLAVLALAFVGLLPLWILLALVVPGAIRLDSPGPVLYRQPRLGRGGKVFRIVKFRTMRHGAEARHRPRTGPPGGSAPDRGRAAAQALARGRTAAGMEHPQRRDEPGRAASGTPRACGAFRAGGPGFLPAPSDAPGGDGTGPVAGRLPARAALEAALRRTVPPPHGTVARPAPCRGVRGAGDGQDAPVAPVPAAPRARAPGGLPAHRRSRPLRQHVPVRGPGGARRLRRSGDQGGRLLPLRGPAAPRGGPAAGWRGAARRRQCGVARPAPGRGERPCTGATAGFCWFCWCAGTWTGAGP